MTGTVVGSERHLKDAGRDVPRCSRFCKLDEHESRARCPLRTGARSRARSTSRHAPAPHPQRQCWPSRSSSHESVSRFVRSVHSATSSDPNRERKPAKTSSSSISAATADASSGVTGRQPPGRDTTAELTRRERRGCRRDTTSPGTRRAARPCRPAGHRRARARRSSSRSSTARRPRAWSRSAGPA